MFWNIFLEFISFNFLLLEYFKEHSCISILTVSHRRLIHPLNEMAYSSTFLRNIGQQAKSITNYSKFTIPYLMRSWDNKLRNKETTKTLQEIHRRNKSFPQNTHKNIG